MLAVFFHHNAPDGGIRPWLASLFGNGYMGVTIFFVLSGFILTVTYERSLVRPTWPRLRNYAVARFARIYPLYILVLLFVIVARGGLPAGWWMHVLTIQPWSGSMQLAFSLNGPGWSVGVEVFLYAMFPLLIVALQPLMRTRKRALALAVCAVAALALAWLVFRLTGGATLPRTDPASAHRWIYRMPLMRLGDFTLGMAVAAAYLNSPEGSGRRWAPWLAVFSLLFIVAAMVTPQTLMTAASYDILYAVPAAVLIYSLAASPAVGLAWFLGTVPLVALGEWSYAFYLIHVPIGARLTHRMVVGGVPYWVAVAITLGILILMSWGLHRLIERPARVWLRSRAFSKKAPAL